MIHITNDINAMLKNEYGIISNESIAAAGGFSTKAAYKISGADGIYYFLKVYDKFLPTTRFFVDRIDVYMPVLEQLSQCIPLRGRVLTPVKTLAGLFKAESSSDVFVLFHFVKGNVPGINGMTRAQTAELAQTIALLHETRLPHILDNPDLAEDVSLPFCDRLAKFLDESEHAESKLSRSVLSHAAELRAAISETVQLCNSLRRGYSPLVLCHGDAHGNNVIQSNRLVLVDWEDLRTAPAEADLFIYDWHPHGDVLLREYAKCRPDFVINRELLRFYVMRRHLEDVWVDIQRLTEENPDEAEAAMLHEYLCSGIRSAIKVYRSSPQ